MQRFLSRRVLRVFVLALALILLATVLPLYRAGAVSVGVEMKTGFDLETMLAKETYGGTRPAYDQIESLRISGDGKLTSRDGQFIKNNLPKLQEISFIAYKGDFGEAAFKDCSTLRRVILPPNARLSREMFFACIALEEVVFQDRYQLSNDCLSYCALDFTAGYPNLINDGNVLTYASNQRPLVYLEFQSGSSGSVRQGQPFRDQYSLRTREGAGYLSLASAPPKWLITRARDLEVVAVVVKDGAPVAGVDTSEPGVYQISYSLSGNFPTNVPSITYTLTVTSGGATSLRSLISSAEGLSEADYTAESFAALRSALTKARSADGSTATSQSTKNSAAAALTNAMDSLQLSLRGAPEAAVVGTSFALYPPAGFANDENCWEYDSSFFSADFSEGAVFTPLAAGTSEIRYMDAAGVNGAVQVNAVAPAGSGGASGTADARPGPQGMARVALYAVLLAALAVLAGIVVHNLRRAAPVKAAAGPGTGAGGAAVARTPAAKRAVQYKTDVYDEDYDDLDWDDEYLEDCPYDDGYGDAYDSAYDDRDFDALEAAAEGHGGKYGR